jgi:hypothetical protein
MNTLKFITVLIIECIQSHIGLVYYNISDVYIFLNSLSENKSFEFSNFYSNADPTGAHPPY